jgi:hypothetical protein
MPSRRPSGSSSSSRRKGLGVSDQVSHEREPLFEVVIPFGRQRQPGLAPAPPIGSLARKRVGFVWDQLFDGDLVFDAIAGELDRSFDGVEFIGYQDFGDIHGADENNVLEALPGRLQQHRVDALVVGVGA